MNGWMDEFLAINRQDTQMSSTKGKERKGMMIMNE
jgi:hypothetical protein